jgi:SAM-dependent methyltransferase
MRRPWADLPVAPATLDRVIDACHLSPSAQGAWVLEFGCGNGRYMEALQARTRWTVVGVDVEPREAFERGRPVARVGGRTAFLPFPDRIFDAVLSSNVVEHIPRPLYLGYLAEIRRILKPGGTLAIGAPNYPIKRLFDIRTGLRSREYRWYYLLDDPGHVNRLSVLRTERDLRRHFVEVRLEPSRVPFGRLVRYAGLGHPLRIFGNKFFGSCVRPLEPTSTDTGSPIEPAPGP